jgi:hypothetical protein
MVLLGGILVLAWLVMAQVACILRYQRRSEERIRRLEIENRDLRWQLGRRRGPDGREGR